MKKLVSITALVAMSAAPVLAGNPVVAPADAVVAAPVAAPMYNDGDWGGPSIGAQIGYGDAETSGGLSLSGNEAFGGVHAGYDFDMGRYVIGAELDYDATNIGLNATDELSNIARLKLRGGYDFGRTLLYATAGFARAEATLAAVSDTDNGYSVGAGVERMVTDRVAVGGELLYNRFDDFGGTGTDIKATTATARVSFKF